MLRRSKVRSAVEVDSIGSLPLAEIFSMLSERAGVLSAVTGSTVVVVRTCALDGRANTKAASCRPRAITPSRLNVIEPFLPPDSWRSNPRSRDKHVQGSGVVSGLLVERAEEDDPLVFRRQQVKGGYSLPVPGQLVRNAALVPCLLSGIKSEPPGFGDVPFAERAEQGQLAIDLLQRAAQGLAGRLLSNAVVLLPVVAIGRLPHILQGVRERFSDAPIDPHLAVVGDGRVHAACEPQGSSVLLPVAIHAAAPHLFQRV